MNEVEKRILENQTAIMSTIKDSRSIAIALDRTWDLLNPPEQPTIAERTHDAFSQSSEVKKNE